MFGTQDVWMGEWVVIESAATVCVLNGVDLEGLWVQ
jgi:hypothetical protein